MYDIKLIDGDTYATLNPSTMNPSRKLSAERKVINLSDPFESFTPGSQLLVYLGVKDDAEFEDQQYLMAVGYVSGKTLPSRFVLLNAISAMVRGIFSIPLVMLRLLLFKKP